MLLCKNQTVFRWGFFKTSYMLYSFPIKQNTSGFTDSKLPGGILLSPNTFLLLGESSHPLRPLPVQNQRPDNVSSKILIRNTKPKTESALTVQRVYLIICVLFSLDWRPRSLCQPPSPCSILWEFIPEQSLCALLYTWCFLFHSFKLFEQWYVSCFVVSSYRMNQIHWWGRQTCQYTKKHYLLCVCL